MNNGEKSFFDTHIHLEALREDLELKQARERGISAFMLPGVSRQGWGPALDFCRRTQGAWAAPGLHPRHAEQWGRKAQQELERLCAEPEVVAIGEIGLDNALDNADGELQQRVFKAQIRLAVEADLPIIIHCRKATGRLLEILRAEGADRVGGIFHGFSGSLESARRAVDLGFAIGLGASLTYPQARRAPQVAAGLDADWLVLETDAPDRAPHPHRGQTNRARWLLLVAAALAQLRDWDLAQTASVTTANARRVLRLAKR